MSSTSQTKNRSRTSSAWRGPRSEARGPRQSEEQRRTYQSHVKKATCGQADHGPWIGVQSRRQGSESSAGSFAHVSSEEDSQHRPFTLTRPEGGRAGVGGLALLLLIAAFSACSCKDDPGDSHRCTSDDDCMSRLGSRWYCRDGTCVMGPRYCQDGEHAECCPGQVCRHGVCLDRYETCSDDADCGILGQRCLPRVVNSVEQEVCTFELCEDGTCPDGLACFAGFCVGEDPCQGQCVAGHACVPSNNRCHPAPMCEATCDDGHLLTFADPGNVDDTCDESSLTCLCHPLLPLAPRDIGRHSSLAVLSNGSMAVSAYNGDYGDLVVLHFDAEGSLVEVDWVDGIPEGARPSADPSGHRGGITDPGPNVGRYTSMAAASDGTLHVSYFDVTNERLKYARRDEGGWITQVVDDDGDVGLYSAITLGATGVPAIAYFKRCDPTTQEPCETALKVARATGPAPAGKSDWAIVAVESLAPPRACAPECAETEQCVREGTSASCEPMTLGCGGCFMGFVCVSKEDGPACRRRFGSPLLRELPEGTGLFPSILTAPDGTLAIAYYDRLSGELKLATGVDPTRGAPGTVSTLAGGMSDDVGRFPSMAIDGSGYLVIAYQHTSRGQAHWRRSNLSGEIVDYGTIDNGLGDPAGEGIRLVGHDNSLVVTPTNRFVVAYQDATVGRLVVAKRDTGGWSREVISSPGAGGFFVSAREREGKLYVSHAVIRSEPDRPVTTRLRIEVVELRP